MGRLSMKKFSSNEGTEDLDLTHLDVNPNYKPNGDEPAEPQEPAQPEPTTIGDDGDTPAQPAVVEPTQNIKDEGDEPAEPQEPAQPEPTVDSSLTPNTPSEPVDVQPTEEAMLKFLSEKLEKKITSFEDLVPKPVEIDPAVKELNEWSKKTGRPIGDYFKYQKDYSQVNDLEVAREFLQQKYPTLNDSEIELELQQYKATEEDLDNEVAIKNLNLKKLATEGRSLFNDLKMELSQPSSNNITPEIKQKLEFADQIQKQIDSNDVQQKQYSEGITAAAMNTESMSIKLTDDLSLDFKMSEEDRKGLPSFINEMPHWKTENGEWNHKAVIDDSIKIKYFDKIVKLAFEQGVNSGEEEIIKEGKNITLSKTPHETGDQPNDGVKKPKYDFDFDKMLGKQKIKMRKKY